MKIALLHQRAGGPAGGGGGVRQMLELGVALRDLGHEVAVRVHDLGDRATIFDAARDLDIQGVRDIGETTPATPMREVLTTGMRNLARLVPGDVDVINAHEWPGLRGGVAASRRTKKPLVWTRNDESFFERAVVPDEAQYPASGARRIALAGLGAFDLVDARHASEIVVLDERNARMVRRAYRREARIVQSGPAAAFFDPPSREEARRALGVPEDAFLVFTFAIFLPHRRFEDVVEAAGSLGAELPNLHLKVVGADYAEPGYADRISELAASSGLGDRAEVHRSGVSEPTLRNLYAAADAYVFANVKQTWGLAPLEALASRTPVVVSTGAGVSDVLRDKPGVFVVDERRPDLIAAALRRIAAGEGRDGLEETRTWVREHLNNRAYAERMLEIYASA